MNIRWWIYDEYSLFDPILDPNKFIPTLYYRPPPIATWIYSSHIYLHLTLSGWAVLVGIVVLGDEAVKSVGRIGDDDQTFDVVDESFWVDVAEPPERDRHRWKAW